MTTQLISGVLGLAINPEGKFLVTLRNEPDNPNMHQKWQVPGGGIEFGEQPIDTLRREMKEELNLIPTILFPYPITATQVWKQANTQVHVNLQCFLITIGQQIPVIVYPETLEWQWVTRDDIYRLKSLPLTRVFIDTATKMCNQYNLLPAGRVVK